MSPQPEYREHIESAETISADLSVSEGYVFIRASISPYGHVLLSVHPLAYPPVRQSHGFARLIYDYVP